MKIESIKSTLKPAFGPVFCGKFKPTKKTSAKKSNEATAGAENQGGIFVKPIGTTKKQRDTITSALSELSKAEFLPNDVFYMQSLGVNLPFKNGADAVKYLNSKNIDITYAKFSNPDVHACLDTTKKTPSILINSNYKDLASFDEILAISEAIMHEASHAKDNDSINSIQEEIDCLASNVLVHEYYKKTYPDAYKNETSPLMTDGVSLYPKLFFDFDYTKSALKKRIAEKYGFLNVASPNHAASKLALDIKSVSQNSLK